MFDVTEPVRTRDGRKARIICTDRNYIDGNIVALVMHPQHHPHESEEQVVSYYNEGYYLPASALSAYGVQKQHEIDLINVVIEHKFHALTTRYGLSSTYYSDEDKLRKRYPRSALIAILKLTFENGVLTTSEVIHVDT